jgi:thioredoxin-related protein
MDYIFFIFLSLFSIVSTLDKENSYSKDYVKAKNPEMLWVIVVSEDWCPACKKLEKELDKVKKIYPKLIVTKVKTTNPIVKKLNHNYLKSNQLEVSLIPDWVIFSYDNEKFVQRGRYIGLNSKGLEKLNNILRLEK